MLEPESVEGYLQWKVRHPVDATELEIYGSAIPRVAITSELLGYTRWAKMKREEE